MLNAAHEGYIYQDLLCAYFVAKYIATGKLDVEFLFDKKLFDEDKFDDFKIFDGNHISFYQIKHSTIKSNHHIEKEDFSTSSAHDLFLYDLYKSWIKQKSDINTFRLCLAWDTPEKDDSINSLLYPIPNSTANFKESTCYKIDCDKLWDEKTGVLSSWKSLRNESINIDRKDFKLFIDSLVIEICCPKLSDDYSQELNAYLYKEVQRIGVGKYPNDNLSVIEACNSLRKLAEFYRSQESVTKVSAREIAHRCGIKLNFGGIDELFPIDKNLYVDIPERIQYVRNILDEKKHIVVTAEPGAGKSWFIHSFEGSLVNDNYEVLKHYCYTSLEDKEFLTRVKVNTFLGSLKEQLISKNPELGQYSIQRYSSSIEEVNTLLNHITQKTVIIIDGIDHVKRLYAKDNYTTSESEIDVINAIKSLDLSNINLYMIIISQPLEDLKSLQTFYSIELPPIPLDFVKTYLKKLNIKDYDISGIFLSQEIFAKSNGNALYCKYILDYANSQNNEKSFDWIKNLPAYDYNLETYYQYLYRKLDGDISVVAALSGVDFSLLREELQLITGNGILVDKHLSLLLPILKYSAVYGYSIYHESFKRYLYCLFKQNRIDIRKKVYRPLIEWLESYDYFKNRKAYACLLKFYYETGEYEKILDTISIDFLENSVYYACSFSDIKRNFQYQKLALPYATDFKYHIILAELSKTVSIFSDYESISDGLINYLEAAKNIVGTETIYHFIQRENNKVDNFEALANFLVKQSFIPEEEVHWELCKFGDTFETKYIKYVVIKLLYLHRYNDFDNLMTDLQKNYHEEFIQAFLMTERWIIVYGIDWLKYTPFLYNFYNRRNPSMSLKTAVDVLLNNEKIHYDDNWFDIFKNIEVAAKNATNEEINEAINSLQNYNWFRNWIIYLILINNINTQRDKSEDIITAFSYLVRDLEPFKGATRTCDLYKQLQYINISFRKGLALCNKNKDTLRKCLDLLIKVTNTTTYLDNSKNGPLTEEDFFELVLDFLPEDFSLNSIEHEINDSSYSGYYQDLANLFFHYSTILFKQNNKLDAERYYKLGVQSMLGYGFHKDISIYEILDCLTETEKYTGLVTKNQIFDLYIMTKTIIMHTDGRDTNSSPVDWFGQLCKISNKYALNFLATYGLSKICPAGYFEEYLSYFLENTNDFLKNDEWFLLCLTAPLIDSDKLLSKGMDFFNEVSISLRDMYRRWVKCIPFVRNNHNEENYRFSDATIKKYFSEFNIDISAKDEKSEQYSNYTSLKKEREKFSANSLSDAINYFSHETLYNEDCDDFIKLLLSLDIQKQKELLLAFFKSISFSPKCKIENILLKIESTELKVFLLVGYFVYKSDGYLKTMTDYKYLNTANELDGEKTLKALSEILAVRLMHSEYPLWQSCNLILALIKLNYDITKVFQLFNLLYKITKKKLPVSNDCVFDMHVYSEIEEFSTPEVFILILISRFNRLGVEKNQFAIYGLIYIANEYPEELLNAIAYVFHHDAMVLPMHRAILLQIVKSEINQNLITDSFKTSIMQGFPKEYYYENLLICELCNLGCNLPIIKDGITLQRDENDIRFFSNINIRYEFLGRSGFSFAGLFSSLKIKRDTFLKKYNDDFYLRADEVLVPNVAISNAIYEIINKEENNQLIFFYNIYDNIFPPFLLENLRMICGAIDKRPSFLPVLDNFDDEKHIKIFKDIESYSDEKWVVLAYSEKQLVGENFKQKTTLSCDYFVYSPEIKDAFCSYIFNINQYYDKRMKEKTNIVSKISVYDYMESQSILFLAPFIIEKLDLHLNTNKFDGLYAVDSKKEIITKMITWKSDYLGNIGDGIEIPKSKGTVLLFRKDKLNLLQQLYSSDLEGMTIRKKTE